MNIAIHIFDAEATADSVAGNAHTHACSMTEAASVLAGLIDSRSHEVCCLASAEFAPDSDPLSAAVDQLKSANAAIGILPDDRHTDLAFIWKRLPLALASFVMAPESRGAILLDTSRARFRLHPQTLISRFRSWSFARRCRIPMQSYCSVQTQLQMTRRCRTLMSFCPNLLHDIREAAAVGWRTFSAS